MTIFPSMNYSSSMLTIKCLFISTTIISIAMSLKLYAPPITDVSIYNGIVSWLKPPYLYLVINCIIITIVASSKLQYKFEHISSSPPPLLVHHSYAHAQPVLEDVFARYSNEATPLLPHHFDNIEVTDYSNKAFGYSNDDHIDKVEDFAQLDVGIVNSEAAYKASKSVGKEYSDASAEKPPIATRFGHHRRIVKVTSEGGKTGLRVSKPRRQDTLESTWKTITEGRAIPLKRHLKKSEAGETHGRHHHHNEQLSRTQTPPGKLKKEPSLGQDELNKRVEAFIKKFNEDMRLQRQQSLNHYMEMINTGEH